MEGVVGMPLEPLALHCHLRPLVLHVPHTRLDRWVFSRTGEPEMIGARFFGSLEPEPEPLEKKPGVGIDGYLGI